MVEFDFNRVLQSDGDLKVKNLSKETFNNHTFLPQRDFQKASRDRTW